MQRLNVFEGFSGTCFDLHWMSTVPGARPCVTPRYTKPPSVYSELTDNVFYKT